MIETICAYPEQAVMGCSALIGALIYAGASMLKKKKAATKKAPFMFDWAKITDTVYQSVISGMVAGLALGCSWVGIIMAMLTGIGADAICNKLVIKDKQLLNLVQLIVGVFTKKTAKKKD